MELPRLDRRHADELVARILGREPEPSLADDVDRRAEGNPLFVEELLCSDCDSGLAAGVPASLRDLLLVSVRRLPDETQEVLRAASAGGQHIRHALLAAVTGLDDDVLTRALRPAVAANVLTADAQGYAFRHGLIREAILDDLMPGDHTRLHTRFAEALGADPGLVPPGRAGIEQAHHWYAAHELTGALVSGGRAAAQAGRALAHAEQLTLLVRVLELWDKLADSEHWVGASPLSVPEWAARGATGRAGASEQLLLVVINESHVLEGMGQHEQAADVARAGIASAEDYGLARSSGALLAINVAEPLVSLGRWDEATEVIDHAMALSPSKRNIRAALRVLSGDIALRRGDLAGAGESLTAARAVHGMGSYTRHSQYHIPLAQLEIELRLAEEKPAEALAAAADADERLDLAADPRYSWPLLAVAARAGAAATAAAAGDAAGRDGTLAAQAGGRPA